MLTASFSGLPSPTLYTLTSSLDGPSKILVQPPTPEPKFSHVDFYRPRPTSSTSSLRHAIFADHSSPVSSANTSPVNETAPLPTARPPAASLGSSRPRPSRAPSSSYFSTTSSTSTASTPTGQTVRPPRRRKLTGDISSASPIPSPRLSPSTSPRDSPGSSPKPGTSSEILDGRKLSQAMRSSRRDLQEGSPSSSASTTPTSSTPVSSAMNSPSYPMSELPTTGESVAPVPIRRPLGAASKSVSTLNNRRIAQGRPTLRSSPTDAAASALRINLDILGRPKFDPVTQTFITDHSNPPAPHTTSSGFPPRSSAPLIRKKSGELVKSSLKSSLTPSYDANPLSAASSASVISDDASDSPYGYSKSLPATPSCPKYVHFDTRLERVRLFLAEQKPAAVSRGGSPSDENGLAGSGSEGFPFPSTSDEEEITRRSLEIRCDSPMSFFSSFLVNVVVLDR